MVSHVADYSWHEPVGRKYGVSLCNEINDATKQDMVPNIVTFLLPSVFCDIISVTIVYQF
jgi:hypothetical protein